MKTLIVYATSHSCTEKIILQMKGYLGGDVTVINLRKQIVPSLKEYNRIIIGGSVQPGRIQKRVNEFCSIRKNELLLKELGLFTCSTESGEVARKQFEEVFPVELREAAKVTAFFGRALDSGRMNFLERMIAEKVPHFRHSTAKPDFEAVRRFSMRMDRIFNPFLFIS